MAHCVNHKDFISVGYCRVCNKPLCEKCIIKTDQGVVCSELCRIELNNISARLANVKSVKNTIPFYKKHYPWYINLAFFGVCSLAMLAAVDLITGSSLFTGYLISLVRHIV